MGAKDIIRTHTCVLIKKELSNFLAGYPIPSEYKVMLPKSNQTIFDALDGYVSLYTHYFSLANLRLPLPRYPANVRVFPDPILFLAGLKPSWEYGQQRPAIIVDGKEPSPDFGTGSSSVSINTEPPAVVVEPTGQLVENTTDSGDSPRQEKLIIHSGSDAARIRGRKYRTRGSSKAPVKRRLARNILRVFVGLPDVLELDVELLDLHDCCYARQAVVDNAVNQRDRELLKVFENMKGECEVLKEREKARDKECEELKAKYEAAMADFDNNSGVKVLQEKIAPLLVEVKEHKASLDRILLENKKWAGYQVSLSTLESKVASLEAEKAKLEATKSSLLQEVKNVKLDRAEVVSKVVPYVAMELVQSDDMGKLVAKLVSFAIFFGRCQDFEEVARMKEPFDLTKINGYRLSYKQEHTKAGNDCVTATFPFLSEVVADPYAFVEALLSKKPWILQRPTLTRTHVLASSAPS
ncbi:hypothetical protein Tco_0252536 [Tanacetum coccineum]